MFWILQLSSSQEEQGRKRQLDRERQRARLAQILGAKPVEVGTPGQALEKAGPGARYQKVAELRRQRRTVRPGAPPPTQSVAAPQGVPKKTPEEQPTADSATPAAEETPLEPAPDQNQTIPQQSPPTPARKPQPRASEPTAGKPPSAPQEKTPPPPQGSAPPTGKREPIQTLPATITPGAQTPAPPQGETPAEETPEAEETRARPKKRGQPQELTPRQRAAIRARVGQLKEEVQKLQEEQKNPESIFSRIFKVLEVAMGFIPYVGFFLKQIPKFVRKAEEWRVKRSKETEEKSKQRELERLQVILKEQAKARLERIQQARAAATGGGGATILKVEPLKILGVTLRNPQLLLTLKVFKIAFFAFLAVMLLALFAELFGLFA